MPSFSEGMAILSAARTLMSQSRYYEMETPLDYAIVHGRADLHERLQKEGLPSEIGTRVVWHEGPALNSQAMAFGLALGCVDQADAGFDLSRLMKPKASLRDIFPWGELACECVLVAFMGLCLLHRNEQVRAACTAAQMRCDGNKILASSDVAKLEAEKRSLTQKIESLHQFLDSRVIWTSYLHNVMERFPAEHSTDDDPGGIRAADSWSREENHATRGVGKPASARGGAARRLQTRSPLCETIRSCSRISTRLNWGPLPSPARRPAAT